MVWWNSPCTCVQSVRKACSPPAFCGLGRPKGSFAQGNIAVRTKRVLDALVESLVKKDKGRSEAEAKEKIKLALQAVNLTIKEDGKSEYLLFLGREEINDVAKIINEKWGDITANDEAATEEKKQGKNKKKKKDNLTVDPEPKKHSRKSIQWRKSRRCRIVWPHVGQYAGEESKRRMSSGACYFDPCGRARI